MSDLQDALLVKEVEFLHLKDLCEEKDRAAADLRVQLSFKQKVAASPEEIDYAALVQTKEEEV